MNNDLISVIIPVFKGFDNSRVLIAIDSLKSQRDVNIEIVVAEQSDEPSLADTRGITYVSVDPTKINNRHSIPGMVRNLAVRSSFGNYVYNSDGDIVFPNNRFFYEILELIKTGKDIALYRPPMRRLPLSEFDYFRANWEKNGIENAVNGLDMTEKFIAKSPGSKSRIKSFRKKESGKIKTFLCTDEDYDEYMDVKNGKGTEPRFFTLDVHAGGTFMERRHFDQVGGFCEKFVAWGCHDADIQWKLRGILNLIEFPKDKEYEVLHLDHPRGYFDEEIWKINRALQQSRRERDVRGVIAEDVRYGI